MNSSGELSSEAEYGFKVSFLYNGQLGVITDDNGLYYMRARYYNPDIKRFINQDILTGNIGNSASLNRYSYVEGNPVSYTDPFGLSPLRTAHDILHALTFIPVVGKGFAVANTVLYLAEGDYAKAGISAIYIIPGGEYVGLGIEATTGVTALILPEDMVENHDNPAIRTLYEYYHYDEMSKGGIALSTLLSGLGAYGGYRSYNAPGVYEGLTKAELADIADDAIKAQTCGNKSEELIHVYRGTNSYAEISAYDETGHLMSDATRHAYRETGNLEFAYYNSASIHNQWIKIWGSENYYVQAHGEFGIELTEAFGIDRTLISVTTDINVAQRFAGQGGHIFEAFIPRSQLIKQTLNGAGESEFLIKLGSGEFK